MHTQIYTHTDRKRKNIKRDRSKYREAQKNNDNFLLSGKGDFHN